MTTTLSDSKQQKDEVIARMSSLWNILSVEQQSFLYDQLTFRIYKKNELIYEEGETPKYLFCLINGKAKIYRTGPNTRSQIMRMIEPGEYFGYRAFFANESYVTTACAFCPSLIALIPMSCIERVTNENHALALKFIRWLAVDLGISDKRSISLTQGHIRGRLAETLLFLKDHYGLEADSATLSIYLSREDLASLSNMTTANAIRTLSAFQSEKLISTDGRKIKLLDEVKLVKIARIG